MAEADNVRFLPGCEPDPFVPELLGTVSLEWYTSPRAGGLDVHLRMPENQAIDPDHAIEAVRRLLRALEMGALL